MSSQTPRPNKMMIETAEHVLISAINKKAAAIAKTAFQKDAAKIQLIIEKFNTDALLFRKRVEQLAKDIGKNSKFKLDVDSYKWSIHKIPKTVDDFGNYETSFSILGANYGSSYGRYEPELKAEREKAAQFILGLKLGTALMADLQTLLDEIAKIK